MALFKKKKKFVHVGVKESGNIFKYLEENSFLPQLALCDTFMKNLF